MNWNGQQEFILRDTPKREGAVKGVILDWGNVENEPGLKFLSWPRRFGKHTE